MDVQKTLHFVDELVFEKTKKHLDNLQRKIIEDLLKEKTYEQISEDNGYTANHIGEVSRKLYQLLSESLGETINKYNFAWTIERAINSKILDFRNNHINYCVGSSNINTHKNNAQEEKIKQEISYYNLTLAPKIVQFYGREKELAKLQDWILDNHNKLVSVLGLEGVGKIHLVKRFIDLNKEQFEVIIWKNFKYIQTLDLLLDDLLQPFPDKIPKKTHNKLSQLLKYMTERKCLFIFEQFHNVFAIGELAGHYQPEYENYQSLLTNISKADHQSSLILISEEKCDEMHCRYEQSDPIKCLELEGLDCIDILKNIGSKDPDYWLELIHLYEGNQSYLKDIAILIKDIYDGKVAEFIAESHVIVTAKMQKKFNHIFNRLSPLEKQIIQALSKKEKPISRSELKSSLDLSANDLFKGLQSLQRRYLLIKIQEEKTLFSLSPVFKQFMNDQDRK